MAPVDRLQPKFVDYIPDDVEAGVLYVSRRFSTATHLCCCGCGHEVVTPLNPAKWSIAERDGRVSLTPSVGNWSFPCRSHYIVSDNRILWASSMSPEAIAAVRRRDIQDAVRLAPPRPSWVRRLLAGALVAWTSTVAAITRPWRK
ncbi:MAG: hypothetical protein EOR97_13045 [Mesorhizobium sp.]|uniref:DUF6527 family protein n=1 Tax=Mesorhizobium sp. TaxID=1871066 RepID=UPI000FE8F678|nr:DUF6527 family protein [Mesorhizobium sp.]RWN31108.1 MAG: hypothetical protein EOR97_13045 [Mesorhizobium sp.]